MNAGEEKWKQIDKYSRFELLPHMLAVFRLVACQALYDSFIGVTRIHLLGTKEAKR